MKKYLLVGLVVCLVLALIGAGVFFVLKGKRAKSIEISQEESGSKTELINDLPLEERPYVALIPSNDGHWVTLKIEKVIPGAEVEYEIIYEMTAEGGQRLNQGVIGHGFAQGTSFNSGKRLFGSESAGKYKFDQEVEGKKIVLRFRVDDLVYKYETEWRLVHGEDEIKSADGLFSLKGNFSPTAFYLVLKTAGLPEPLAGEVVAGPYGVFTAAGETVKNAQASLVLKETNSSVKFYQGGTKGWEELKAEIKDGKILAKTENVAVFVAVKPQASE